MNYNKTTKTILFAFLIAAMILPFSGMMMAEAAPNENASDKAKDKTKDKIHDKKYWLELHQDKIFKNMSQADKKQYQKNLEKYIEQRIPEQIELDTELEILSKIILDDRKNGMEDDVIIESKKFDDQLKKIKNLRGVKLSEKIAEYAANPSDQPTPPLMPELYDTTNTSNVSGESSMGSIFPVYHMGSGVELGHGAYLKYPALDVGGIIIHFVIWDTTSHATGAEWRYVAIQTSPHAGVWSFMSEICLNEDGSSSSVSFKQTSSNVVLSSLNTLLHSNYQSYDRTLSTEGLCYKILKDTSNSITAGSSGSEASGLTNISVS